VALSRSIAIAVLLCLAPRTSGAQVLTIADTLGKGKSGLLFSDNVLVPGDDIPNLNVFYGLWAKGLSGRFDLYLEGGGTTTDGETQAFLGGGGNLRLARIEKLSFSLFGIATVPLNRRGEACQVLLNPALVASMPVSARLVLYSGVNSLIPIGSRARGIFTPPSNKVNLPVGGTYAIGPWGIWAEGDFGTLNALGLGLTRTW
jgi:hypothetical protein